MSSGTSRFLKTLKRAGWRKRLEKINEIITGYNPLLNIKVEKSSATGQEPEILYSKNNIILIVIDYQPQIDALDARLTTAESTLTNHESRITALEP